MKLTELDAVLFDFNGTLSDDEDLLAKLYIRLAASECGVPLTATRYRTDYAGLSDVAIAEALIAESDTDQDAASLLNRLHREYIAEVTARPRIRPEAVPLIHGLATAGVPVGIVTGAARVAIDAPLHTAGIHNTFAVIITQEDIEHPKPAPEGFLRAAAELKATDPGRVAVIEDSMPGLAAAARANMIALALTGTHTTDQLQQHAHRVVPRLDRTLLQLPLPCPADMA